MKKQMIYAIALGLLSIQAAMADTGRSTGNGGDIIECEANRTNNLRGKYFLDYVITYQRDQRDIVNVHSWDESRERIFNELNRINPYLANHFQNFTNNIDNYTDYTKNYIWEEHSFGVVNIQDENITTIIPANCLVMRQRRVPVVSSQSTTTTSTSNRHDIYLQNRYGTTEGYIEEQATSSRNRDEIIFENQLVPTAKLSQLVVRTLRGNNTTVFEYAPELDVLKQNQPLQFSYAIVHEWLWEFTNDVNLIRRVNRLLHSQHLSAISNVDQFEIHTLGLSVDSNYLGVMINGAPRIPFSVMYRENAYHALIEAAKNNDVENFHNRYQATEELGLNIQNPRSKIFEILNREEYANLQNILNTPSRRIIVSNTSRELIRTFDKNVFKTAIEFGSIGILNLYKQNGLAPLTNYIEATRVLDAANLPIEIKNTIHLLLTQIFSLNHSSNGAIPENFSFARSTVSLQAVYDNFLNNRTIVLNNKFFEFTNFLLLTNSFDLYRQVIREANIVTTNDLAKIINGLFLVNTSLSEEENQQYISTHVQLLQLLLSNKTRADLQNARFNLNIIPFLTKKGRLPLLRALDRATGLAGPGVRGNLNHCTNQDLGTNTLAILDIFEFNRNEVFKHDIDTIIYVFTNYNLGCNVLSEYNINTFNFLGSTTNPFMTNNQGIVTLIAKTNLKLRVLESIAPRMSFSHQEHNSMIYFKQRPRYNCTIEGLGDCVSLRSLAMRSLRQSCHSYYEEREGHFSAIRSKRRYCDNWLNN